MQQDLNIGSRWIKNKLSTLIPHHRLFVSQLIGVGSIPSVLMVDDSAVEMSLGETCSVSHA